MYLQSVQIYVKNHVILILDFPEFKFALNWYFI